MRSITAAFLLSSPCASHRIHRDIEELEAEVDTSVDVKELAADPLQTMNSLPAGAGPAVDWHFMTPTFSWAGRGDQEVFDTVQGHACQSNGYYDQGYYATSLCYWHPETEHLLSAHWGLNWRGGYGAKEFCGTIGLQSGVCARCSVCHDNSRDRDAQVDNAAANVEIIPLPDCMKEGAIEAECNRQFDNDNAGLLHQESVCRETQRLYEEAVANFNTVSGAITGSEAAITELVNHIAQGYPQGAHCGQEALRSIRRAAVRQCRQFDITHRHSNAEVFAMKPRCELPVTYSKLNGGQQCEEGTVITDFEECRRALSGLGCRGASCQVTRRSSAATQRGCSAQQAADGQIVGGRFNPGSGSRSSGSTLAPVCKITAASDGNTTHRRCERCAGHVDNLQTAIQDADAARTAVEAWQGNIAATQEQMTNHRNILAQSYQALPHATHYKTQNENQWLPQQQQCEQIYSHVVSARNQAMQACAPRFYDQSCEKACVEIQRTGEHGCGVVEGSQYGDEFQRGGVEVTCVPPAPSWIMSPSNYGGSPHVNSAEQCGRINAEQSARATTPVLKSGWLTRPGTGWFNGDKRRFYVLESGDGVRSATLRSFDDALPDGSEEGGGDDGIIMWDAEEVTASETTRDRACFEIKHRFEGRVTRWQRRGVTTTICVTRADSNGNMRGLRDEWVSVLQGLIVWRARVA